MSGTVQLSIRDSSAAILIDNPESLNAMTLTMYRELDGALDVIASDATLRSVTLRGAGGKAFMTGSDIRDVQALDGPAAHLAYVQDISRIMTKLEHLHVPTLAVVEGFAFGGGFALAAACDLRVCVPDARFAVSAAQTMGISPTAGALRRLVTLVGRSRAIELVVVGVRIDGQRAADWGLVNACVSSGELDIYVQGILERISRSAPLATRTVMELVQGFDTRQPIDDHLLEALYGSADFAEGMAAFLERRRPVWRNK